MQDFVISDSNLNTIEISLIDFFKKKQHDGSEFPLGSVLYNNVKVFNEYYINFINGDHSKSFNGALQNSLVLSKVTNDTVSTSDLIVYLSTLHPSPISCGEISMGKFGSAGGKVPKGLSFTPQVWLGTNPIEYNLHQRIRAFCFFGYLLKTSLHLLRQYAGHCYLFITVVKNANYDFYFKFLKEWELHHLEIEFKNTNTTNTTYSVQFYFPRIIYLLTTYDFTGLMHELMEPFNILTNKESLRVS